MTTTIASVDVGGTGVTTSTGTGSNVLNTSPTLVTPTLSDSTSGGITLAVPAVAGSNTATLPAATGTVMVSGNMPAFSAYQSSAQTPSANTLTKIQFQSKEFDTANAFDSTTNYRFIPQVAGYYQVNGEINVSVTACNMYVVIYKNGSAFKFGSNPTSTTACGVNALIYFNGSTDYIELYGSISTSQALAATTAYTYFQASMVRSA